MLIYLFILLSYLFFLVGSSRAVSNDFRELKQVSMQSEQSQQITAVKLTNQNS